jgi:RimJ/RimL family protein N-acetyltransferase
MFELTTARLRLRPLRSRDIDAVMALAGDVRVARMLTDMPHPATHAAMRKWLRSSRGETRYAIEHQGQFIGSVGYFYDDDASVELGYWLGPAWWGLGFAAEAARALLEFAVATDGIEQVTASYFIDNAASAKVLRQLGFEPVAQRPVWCPARGAEVDAVFCRLDTDRIGVQRPVFPGSWLPRTVRRALLRP